MANVIPVYMYLPQKVVLFSSDQEVTKATHLSNLFKRKKIETQIVAGLNAYSYLDFRNAISKSLSEINEGEVWLNITGGTKIMAIAAFDAFIQADYNQKKIFYSNTPDKQIDFIYPLFESTPYSLGLSVDDYFLSYGYKILVQKKTNIPRDVSLFFDFLDENNYLKQYILFTNEFRRTYQKIFLYKSIRTNLNNNTIELIQFNQKFIIDNLLNFLNGLWLEYYVVRYLSANGIASSLSVKIHKINTELNNEFDVVFIKDFSMRFISCKSGGTSRMSALYELDSLKNATLGILAKPYFVASSKVTNTVKERAASLNITCIDIAKHPQNINILIQ